MFVARTILRMLPWVGRNAFICCDEGSPAYNGHISTFESKMIIGKEYILGKSQYPCMRNIAALTSASGSNGRITI